MTAALSPTDYVLFKLEFEYMIPSKNTHNNK